MDTYIIYKATAPNGKVYIGLTKHTLEMRRKQHEWVMFREKRHFYNALRKYGADMLWEVLETGEGREWAVGREEHYIAHYNSLNPNHGYNLTKGGDGTLELRASTRALMSLSAKNRRVTHNQLANLKYGRVSRPHSEATKQRLRALGTGRQASEETRAAMSRAKKSVPHGHTHKLRMQMAQAHPVLRDDGRPFSSARRAAVLMGAANDDAVAKALRRGGTCGGFTFRAIPQEEYEVALIAWDKKVAEGHTEREPVWTRSRAGHRHNPTVRANMSRAKKGKVHTPEHHKNRIAAISKRVLRSDGRTFDSILKAAQDMGLTPGQITYSIRTGCSRDGMTFSWA